MNDSSLEWVLVLEEWIFEVDGTVDGFTPAMIKPTYARLFLSILEQTEKIQHFQKIKTHFHYTYFVLLEK